MKKVKYLFFLLFATIISFLSACIGKQERLLEKQKNKEFSKKAFQKKASKIENKDTSQTSLLIPTFTEYIWINPFGDSIKVYFKTISPTKLSFVIDKDTMTDEMIRDTNVSEIFIDKQGKKLDFYVPELWQTIRDSPYSFNTKVKKLIPNEWIREAKKYHTKKLPPILFNFLVEQYTLLKERLNYNHFELIETNLDNDDENEIILFVRYEAFYDSYAMVLNKENDNYFLTSVANMHTWGKVARNPIIKGRMLILSDETHGTAQGGYYLSFYKYENQILKKCLEIIDENFQGIFPLGVDEVIKSEYYLQDSLVRVDYTYEIMDVKKWVHTIKYFWNDQKQEYVIQMPDSLNLLYQSGWYVSFLSYHESELKRLSKYGTKKQKDMLSMAAYYWEMKAKEKEKEKKN